MYFIPVLYNVDHIARILFDIQHCLGGVECWWCWWQWWGGGGGGIITKYKVLRTFGYRIVDVVTMT